MGVMIARRSQSPENPALSTSDQTGGDTSEYKNLSELWEYAEIEGGISITKYHGNDDRLVLPEELDGKRVPEIGDGSVWDYVLHDYGETSDIEEIELPEGITRLGYLSFAELSRLETVNIPESVTSFGGSLFRGCSAIESMTLPEGITEIDTTFYECTSLSGFTIPKSVERLYATFENCGKLTSIVIPGNVTSIDAAFENCTALTSLTIPDSVTKIDPAQICGCLIREMFTIMSSLPSFLTSGLDKLKCPVGGRGIFFGNL